MAEIRVVDSAGEVNAAMAISDPVDGPSLGWLIDAVGTHVLDILLGDPATSGPVMGWSIYDPLDASSTPAGAVVLGVGVGDPESIETAVRKVAGDGAVALVLRAGVHVDEAVFSTPRGSSLVVLSLAEGSSWQELSNSLRSELDELACPDEPPAVFAGLPINDLFSLANAICLLIDAPVTIEDRSSRVLAFSDRQDETDPARIATVLGRQTPQTYVTDDEARGAMRALRRSDRPVFIEPGDAEDARTALPRVAIAVRAGDELLGFIWAVVREPLSPERDDLLVEAARFAALMLLDARSGADAGRSQVAPLLGAVLEGRDDAAEAVAKLGLAGDSWVVVVIDSAAAGPSYAGAGPFGSNAAALARRSAARRRLANAFAMHLASLWPGSVVAEIGERIYGLLPVKPGDAALDAVVRTCHQFLDNVGEGLNALVGVGSVAADLAGVKESRVAADRTVRVLRVNGGGARVARTDEVDDKALLLDLRDLILGSGAQPSGAFARLQRYDTAKEGGSMVITLRAWLDSHGDVPTAAAVLHVHENTLRYRLRRISEIGQVDLADPDSRLILALQLTVFGLPSAGPAN